MEILRTLKRKLRRLKDYGDLVPGVLVERLRLDAHSKYFFEYIAAQIAALESNDSVNSREAALRGLRSLGLDDFGLFLWSLPDKRFPKLSTLLPSMASRAAQLAWTGRSGTALLRQSLDFVRISAHNFARLTSRPLLDARILDFGCGYGRMARLMYYFADESNVIGVDPMESSIAQCRSARLGRYFHLSDYLPRELPVGAEKFDFIYAFSVFTHVSERAFRVALATLRNHVRADGLLAITIRPVEYWQFATYLGSEQAARLEQDHRTNGIAFYPHGGTPVDGDITYGDTSVTLSWLAQNCPGWSIAALDRSINDRMQTYVYLRPSETPAA